MPNRVLREGLRASEAINALSDAGERLYTRLLVTADDYGLIEMRPAWVKANAVPLLEWSMPTVAKLLAELVDNGLLMPYEINGKQYAAIAKWAQRIEAKHPKFPMPPWGREHIVGGLDRSQRDRSKGSGDLPSGRPVGAHAMPTPEERGTRNEDKNLTAANAAVAGADGAPPCPHLELIAIWHEVMPELPPVHVARWGGSKSEGSLRNRWREGLGASSGWWRFSSKEEGLRRFRELLVTCRESDFLMGRTFDTKRGAFRLTLHWLLKRDNFDKVLSNTYHREAAA